MHYRLTDVTGKQWQFSNLAFQDDGSAIAYVGEEEYFRKVAFKKVGDRRWDSLPTGYFRLLQIEETL